QYVPTRKRPARTKRTAHPPYSPSAAGPPTADCKIHATPTGWVPLIGVGGVQRVLPDTLGMELREGFPRFVFGALPVFEGFATGPSDPPERFGRSYPFSLQDARTGNALCESSTFEIEIDIQSTPGPDYGSVRFQPVSTQILANGTLSAQAGPCP
ncbi:MAG: hypothetical protein AAFY60_19990, partial [Myxococcota bacterium]